jgi:serine protease Do
MGRVKTNSKKIIGVSWIICCLVSVSVYAESYTGLQRRIVNLTQQIGSSVVSVVGIRDNQAKTFYFGTPLVDRKQQLSKNFFYNFYGEAIKEYGSANFGSGFVIDDQGHILTNAHIVAGAKEVKVFLEDGRQFAATIKGYDSRSDLAVVKISGAEVAPLELGDSGELEIGHFIVTFGGLLPPLNKTKDRTSMVSLGVVSALDRHLPESIKESGFNNLIQIDAMVNPANSGGPMVNLSGEVVGVNIVVAPSLNGFENVGFALRINKAKDVLDNLIKGQKIEYGWIGLNIQNLNKDLRSYFGVDEKRGVIVVQVIKDSPADNAEIKAGDLILSFDSHTISNVQELTSLISETSPGQDIVIDVIRNGNKKTINLTVGSQARAVQDKAVAQGKTVNFKGAIVQEANNYFKDAVSSEQRRGIVVVDLEQGSPAAKSGLVVGDIILEVNGIKVDSKEKLTEVKSDIEGNCLVRSQRGYFIIKDK